MIMGLVPGISSTCVRYVNFSVLCPQLCSKGAGGQAAPARCSYLVSLTQAKPMVTS